MIITISGTPGAGKTTTAEKLAKKLRHRRYSLGLIRRAMARERGLTLEEFNTLGEKKDFTDRSVDQWQAKQGKKLKNGIFEGRTSFHFIPHSYKIFLQAEIPVAAKRIKHDRAAHRRFEANWSDIHSVETALRRRMRSDSRRYRKYYGLNIYDRGHYDLVLDTTRLKPSQVVSRITKFLMTDQAKAAVDNKRKSIGVVHKTHRGKSKG